MANDDKKKRPFIPRDGSELPHNILIPLRNFNICHHTHQQTEYKNNTVGTFLGRDNLIKALISLLENNKTKKGSYLIAGYRGSGKTSLINQVISKYQSEIKKDKQIRVVPININLGHDAVLDTRHVLFNIVSVIKNEVETIVCGYKLNPVEILFISIIFLGLTTYISTISSSKFCSYFLHFSFFSTLLDCRHYIRITITVLLSLMLISSRVREYFRSLLKFNFKKGINSYKLFSLNRAIHNLHDRIAYSGEINLGVSNSAVPYQPFLVNKKTVMPAMMEPQIELAILDILKQCKDVGLDIIFIFDELDKISLSVTDPQQPLYNKDLSQNISRNETVDESVIKRKKRVDILLGSLKTLITVGQARFFFIAGRDMLDSYQAEKGSTSSLYESLFNQVFEVPSFLTDKSEQDKMRLHSMIEIYVCSRLIDENCAKKEWLSNLLCSDILDSFRVKISDAGFDKNEAFSNIFSMINEFVEPSNCIKKLNIFNHNYYYSLFVRVVNNVDRITEKNDQQLAKYIRIIIKDLFSIKQISQLIKNPHNKKLVELEAEGDDYPYFSVNTYFLYLLDQLESGKDAEIIALTLRQFIYYLTIHSWGNCKRLATLFESFVKPYKEHSHLDNDMDWLPAGNDKNEANYMLFFGITEKQRIAMGSDLYVKFSHHLSHQFTGADKLAVTSMAAFHYCLKFHRTAFSRHHLFRMTEMMTAYSAPELNNILDTTITQVLWPYLRIIRGGMYRYRFFNWIEQEIRYIARTNDLESASYTFSLDSINEIKAHYRKTLEAATATYGNIKDVNNPRSPSLIAEINIVLGDIHFLERSYDEAVVYFQSAVNAHHDLYPDSEKCPLENLSSYVEALLKLGNVQEYRQRYDRAMMNYLKANELVNDFLAIKKNRRLLEEFIRNGNSRFELFVQPYWAIKFLSLKRGSGQENIKISPPIGLYSGSEDPQFLFRKGQLCFYLHQHDKAEKAFLNIVKKINKTEISSQTEFESYLWPTACINLAENFFVKKMRKIEFDSIRNNIDWKAMKNKLSIVSVGQLGSMLKINSMKDLIGENDEIPTDVKSALSLIIKAAHIYEKHKLYDHAAMAYLKAISLWNLMFDMLPLYHFENEGEVNKKIGLKDIFNVADKWLPEVCDKALEMIMASNGYAHQQAREKWHIRDVVQAGVNPDVDVMGYIKINKLGDTKTRDNLNKDIAFWQSSYLGQQLVFMRNWSFLIQRVLQFKAHEPKKLPHIPYFIFQDSALNYLSFYPDFSLFVNPGDKEAEPSLLMPYRIPVHTTRAYVFACWANTRELLRLARFIRTGLTIAEKAQENYKKKIEILIIEKYEKYIKHEKVIDSGRKNDPYNAEDYYYIIVAKGITNAYTALHNIRVLTENNQALMFPPPGFVMSNLWRLLYRLVEYEREKFVKEVKKLDGYSYEKIRVAVRARLAKFVSQDIPSSHLDLDFVSAEAKRQLHALSTMGDVTAISRINILQNNYYLNDDYEDPGFHLDWTLTQMLIPCALMTIQWIDEDMKSIREKPSENGN